MTDPQNPHSPADMPPAPSSPAAPGYPAASAYPAAPGYPGGAYPSPQTSIPGRGLGIAAFILSFFMQLVGLILGIIALVQSRKAGQKNGLALAAIIISGVLMVLGIIVGIVVLSVVGNIAHDIVTNCQTPGGSGYVEVWGQKMSCSEVSR